MEIKIILNKNFRNLSLGEQGIKVTQLQELKTDSILNFLPKEFYLEWGNGRKKFGTQFCFDEDEVLDSFRKEINTSEPLVLELILSDRCHVVKAVLRNTNSKFVFKDKY